MQKSFEEESISLKDLILTVFSWVSWLWQIKLKIVLLCLVIAVPYILYQTLRKPVYTAETTFVLEGSSDSKGGLSSLASVVGVNVNNVSQDNELFDTDHIVELYRSYRMLKKTFLQNGSDDSSERLVSIWLSDRKWLSKIRSEEGLENFSFEVPEEIYTVKHDSIMKEVIEDFNERQLSVSKVDRKLSILSVKILDKNSVFAKVFNESLVQNVNEFYEEVKTKKTGENLRILQIQADSVKSSLDELHRTYSREIRKSPSPNPIYNESLVQAQKLQIDIEISAAVYEEVAKNLEIAKITHRNNMPLLQIIDQPTFPLEDDKDSILKTSAISIIIGGVLSVLGLSLFAFFRGILET